MIKLNLSKELKSLRMKSLIGEKRKIVSSGKEIGNFDIKSSNSKNILSLFYDY